MKVLIKQDTTIWVNGKPYEFKKGIQEVDDDIAIILIESKNAEKQEETDAKKTKKSEAQT
ncbi:hypothetical protein [Thermodesulfobacterium commune]|jgi:flagellar basal body L-ring protein FlgH|uniref:Uncharacterized protein n=1 Tax=Thermodesulfobacterium commune DSM 2178 TaxID=289377 RepID=A0A075WVH4_9BACT|nr:hypothetical protein [Thermodesulfobacterium commune]AIH04473.1 hypothetical protein HL41_07070 [Thermodesulfobacterium commune DSM 2178]